MRVSRAYVGPLCMDQVEVQTEPWKSTKDKQATDLHPMRLLRLWVPWLVTRVVSNEFNLMG